jgi:hypothetical protein
MIRHLIRPLGLRECLVGFELLREGIPTAKARRDIREEWTLWDPEGLPHPAYPDMEVQRAMTGREVMEWQEQAWAEHAGMTRRLFGASPLAGVPRAGAPLRGVLAFPIAYWSDKGRWTLRHRNGEFWNFTPAQIHDGTPRPTPPAGEMMGDGQ